ncbi:MAG: transcription elongation factor Spt5 [archaeon]|nr:transcription elongation factor Spt5 [archaeon]MCP8317666.1 transcription elongation factor Spt5 [archaeon]
MSKKPSRLFAIKTTGGQEKIVAEFVANRVSTRKLPVYSILVLDDMRGYVFLETDSAQVVSEAVSGIKHVKGLVPGMIQYQDIEKFLITKPIISELKVDDIVEIIAGPFKGMRAKINRIELTRSEVTVVLLDAPYQLPVTIDANYLKLSSQAKSEGS